MSPVNIGIGFSESVAPSYIGNDFSGSVGLWCSVA